MAAIATPVAGTGLITLVPRYRRMADGDLERVEVGIDRLLRAGSDATGQRRTFAKPASSSTSSSRRCFTLQNTKHRPRTACGVACGRRADRRQNFVEDGQVWTRCDLATLLDGRSEGHAHDRFAVLFE